MQPSAKRAVLALREARLITEAQPSARACLEHAIMLRRLALAVDHGQLEPLTEDIAFQAQRRQLAQLDYLDQLDEEGGGTHHGLLQAARRRLEADQRRWDKNRPQTGTVKAVFYGVPDGRHLYEVYKRLSESTHAGLGSAAGYLMDALRADGAVPAAPPPPPWAETAALLCWSCWAAEDAMLRFLSDGTDLAARQAELLARIGLASG